MPTAVTSELHRRVNAVLAAIDEKATELLLPLLAPDVVFRFGNADPVQGHDAANTTEAMRRRA